MKILGALLCVIGIIVFGVALAIDTSVSTYGEFGGRVNNTGLLQQQMIAILAGLTLFLSGIVLLGFGGLAETVSKNGFSNSNDELEPEKNVAELSPYEKEVMDKYLIRKENGKYIYGDYSTEFLHEAINKAKEIQETLSNIKT